MPVTVSGRAQKRIDGIDEYYTREIEPLMGKAVTNLLIENPKVRRDNRDDEKRSIMG